MGLREICVEENKMWSDCYGTAYRFRNGNVKKTVFCCDIPLLFEEESEMMARMKISEENHGKFYHAIAQGIQRHIASTNLLKMTNIPSILFSDKIYQEKDPKTARTSIYLVTEEVRPILDTLLKDRINLISLLDIFIRLSIIIRDITKPQCLIAHRGISLDYVYVNEQKKILLGGFFYAAIPGQGEALPYLPGHGTHLPSVLRNGAVGSPALDMQSLSLILYNLCSGLPWNTEWPALPMVAPEYAPEELAQVLRFGMTCSDDQCNKFRRELLNCRKTLSKTPSADIMVPIRKALLKEYRYF